MDGFNADKLVRHTHIHTQHLNVNIKKTWNEQTILEQQQQQWMNETLNIVDKKRKVKKKNFF